MGQAISGILKTTDAVAKDVADSAEAAAQDSLNVMLDLAKAKQSNFLAGLNTVQLHMCPIQTFLVSSQEIRCSVTAGDKNIGTEIGGVLKRFVSKDFLAGITELLEGGMKVLFNNYSGSVSEKQEFVLSVGPLGGVYRIDYYMYSYRFQSKRLSEMVKNVLLVCYAISSVKVEELTDNDCRSLIQLVYGGNDNAPALLESLLTAVRYERTRKAKSELPGADMLAVPPIKGRITLSPSTPSTPTPDKATVTDQPATAPAPSTPQQPAVPAAPQPASPTHA